MAKGSINGTSPAVNWFFNDWAGGTAILSRHQKGCYMDLLHAQFNNGHLSLEEVKNVLGNDFAVWGVLSKKFKTDAEGKFYNVRLEDEIVKRVSYSESQSKRRSGKSPDDPGGNGKGIGNELEKEKFIQEAGKHRDEFSEILIHDFLGYWLEQSKTGKYRFQAEKFFDHKKRLGTFLRNDHSGKYTHAVPVNVFDQIRKENANT